MGVLAWVLAFAGPGMSTDGWQVRVSAWLQHLATVGVLDWLPGWVFAAALLAGFVVVLRRGLRTRVARRADAAEFDSHALETPVAPPAAVDTVNSKES
jgi:cytochrome c-type biogenesis protein